MVCVELCALMSHSRQFNDTLGLRDAEGSHFAALMFTFLICSTGCFASVESDS